MINNNVDLQSKKINRVVQGIVVGTKMAKTISVKVERMFKHPLFDKPIRRQKIFQVHDGASLAKVGDVVVVRECRPISKTKHMILHEVVSK